MLVKRKPAKIGFDEISLLRNIPGTNSFVIEYEKWEAKERSEM